MKRYVLLEDKTIVDRQDTIYQNVNEILMVKQSDNLLDLLEVGDMLELKNKDNETFIFHMCDKETYNNTMDDIKDLTEEDNAYVVAIWKRNGDVMRRYER